MKMTCLLIDDERLARVELRHMLTEHSDVIILGEAKNATEAREFIEQKKPDFLFLDIQMPGTSGFELLQSLNDSPKVIFTTAYDQYAINAFELHALDYLLKPISPERLQKSIDRMQVALGQQSTKVNYLDHLFLPIKKQFRPIHVAQIFFIQSIGNYAQLHTADQKGMIKTSLSLLEKQLDPTLFFRINRSTIINTQQIEKIWPDTKILKVALKNNMEFQMSERKSIEFKRRIKI